MSTTFRSAGINFKVKIKLLLTLAFLLVFVTSAQAVLFRMGPIDEPTPPGNGFPVWYQDTQGLALDLCLPINQAQLDAGICLILPPDQDPVEGLNLPLVFPTNFPGESFWWNATAVLDLDVNNRAVLVLAVEAAFTTEDATAGEQISFGRLRIVADAPVSGTYTVTTPYGVKVFPDVVAGPRAITFTSDIGIGALGDFSGALQSDVGPFLLASSAPGGAPLPFVTVPGDTSGDQFLSDAAAPVFVTGSPIADPDNPGQQANIYRICVDTPGGLDGAGTACQATILFSLMGKVHSGAIGSPLTVDRATYARSGGLAHVDVFANASAGPGAATPNLFFSDAGGTNLTPSALMNGPTNLGQYYGQSIPFDATALPASVIVTNVGDNPPSSVTQSLVDEVTLIEASYDPGSGNLTITATSSDKGDSPATTILPPQLFVVGLPGSVTGSDELTLLAGADPAARQGVFLMPPFAGGPVPPFAVNVISSAGGHDTEVITTVAGGVFAAGGPVAIDDAVTVEAGSALFLTIPVLANDFGYSPTTVQIVSQGTNGIAVADPLTGEVTYTFTNPLLVGDDFFAYTVMDAAVPAIESNVAFVSITTTPGVGGSVPLAVDDGPFDVQVNAQLVIPAATLIANDLGNGGTIDPASIQIESVTGGTAAVAGNGDVTYTAGAVVGNTFSIQYTVANTLATGGLRSAAATVRVRVISDAAVLAVTSARFRTGRQRWDVVGTSTVGAPNTVTARLVQGGVVGAVIGTSSVGNLGNWALRAEPSNVIAVNGDSVQVTSTAGGTTTFAVQVRN